MRPGRAFQTSYTNAWTHVLAPHAAVPKTQKATPRFCNVTQWCSHFVLWFLGFMMLVKKAQMYPPTLPAVEHV